MLVPPASFGIAEEGIYRCSKVETLNLSFLEGLNLKTVIFVGGTEPSKFFKEFFTRSSIEWTAIRTADFSTVGSPLKNDLSLVSPHSYQKMHSDEDTESRESLGEDGESIHSGTSLTIGKNKVISPQKMAYHFSDSDDLMLIKSKSLQRIFEKLLDRKNYNTLLVDKTSLVIGILRKIQKWNISSIINEYRLFAGKNRGYFAETFLEMIQIKIEQTIEERSLDEQQIDTIVSEEQQLPCVEHKSNPVELVDEDLLCDEPEVPERQLHIVEEAERKNRIKDIPRVNNILISDTSTSSSDLGIFGHRYRLAFTQKEQGQYEYYKSQDGNDDIETVCLKIPKENDLPGWFKFQRDLWEQENIPQIHHFYKEQIYI